MMLQDCSEGITETKRKSFQEISAYFSCHYHITEAFVETSNSWEQIFKVPLFMRFSPR